MDVPDFDEEAMRAKVNQYSKDDLIDMLIIAYKQNRLAVKMMDESEHKLKQLKTILGELTEVF